jgi:hypothetical protein
MAANKRSSNNKIASMSINGKSVKDPKIIANSFNIFFSSMAQNSTQDSMDEDFIRNSIQNQIPNNQEQCSSHFNPTSPNEINKIIKSKDSFGYDEISLRILKISAPCILFPLTPYTYI